MKRQSRLWNWLSNSKTQKTLAFVGGGLVVLVGGAWQAYLHFSDKDFDLTKSPHQLTTPSNGIEAGRDITVKADKGGIAVIANGNVTIGIPLEEYEARLKQREQEVRAELSRASAAEITLLERQLAEIQAKLEQPESTLEEYKAKLAQAYKAFDDLKLEVPPEQLKQAQEALTKGETTTAENVFKKVLDSGKENAAQIAAEMAYQLGELAYNRIDYRAASTYFQSAVDLNPENEIYLSRLEMLRMTVNEIRVSAEKSQNSEVTSDTIREIPNEETTSKASNGEEGFNDYTRYYKRVDTVGVPFLDPALNEREDERQIADNRKRTRHYVIRFAHLGWGFGPSIDALGLKTCFNHDDSPVSVHKTYKLAVIAFPRVKRCFFQPVNMPDDSWNKSGLNIEPPRTFEIFIPNVVAIDMDTNGTWPFGRRLEDQVATRFLSLFLDMEAGCSGGQKCNVDTLGNPALWAAAPIEPKTPPNPLVNDKPFLKEFPYLAEPWSNN